MFISLELTPGASPENGQRYGTNNEAGRVPERLSDAKARSEEFAVLMSSPPLSGINLYPAIRFQNPAAGLKQGGRIAPVPRWNCAAITHIYMRHRSFDPYARGCKSPRHR